MCLRWIAWIHSEPPGAPLGTYVSRESIDNILRCVSLCEAAVKPHDGALCRIIAASYPRPILGTWAAAHCHSDSHMSYRRFSCTPLRIPRAQVHEPHQAHRQEGAATPPRVLARVSAAGEHASRSYRDPSPSVRTLPSPCRTQECRCTIAVCHAVAPIPAPSPRAPLSPHVVPPVRSCRCAGGRAHARGARMPSASTACFFIGRTAGAPPRS